LNPSRVIIGSDSPDCLQAGEDINVLALRSVQLLNKSMDNIHQELHKYVSLLYQKANETELPPLQWVNH
jgi:hypothetical protein